MAPIRRRHSDESGAEIIEFSLVLPLLLLLVLGIFDFGLVFRAYEIITNAAREGARLSVLSGYTTTDVQTRVDQYVQAAGLGGPGTVTTATLAGVSSGDSPRRLAVGAGLDKVNGVVPDTCTSSMMPAT